MKDEILVILKKLAKLGFEVAVVGGAVRDIIAGQDVRDWDLTTSARPKEILKILQMT